MYYDIVFTVTFTSNLLRSKIIAIVAGGILIAVIIGILLLNVVVEVEQRKALENIQIEFVDVAVKDIGFIDVGLEISLDMYNPNDVVATLDRSEFELWFNDNYLGEGTILQETDIPPFASRQVDTEFNLSYLEAGDTVISALTEEQHIWRIKGTAHYDSVLGTIDIPFDIIR